MSRPNRIAVDARAVTRDAKLPSRLIADEARLGREMWRRSPLSGAG